MKHLSFLTFIVPLLLCVVIPTKAQHAVFKIGGGFASHYGSSTRNIGSFHIGLGYNYRLGGHWSVEPSLLYYAKGWKDKDKEVWIYDDGGNIVTDDNGNQLKGVMNVTTNANYLELPLLICFSLPSALDPQVTLQAGPYIAYGIGGKSKSYGDTSQTGAERFFKAHSTFDRNDMNRFDAGVTLGANYHFNEQLSAGLNFDFGLTNSTNQGAKNISVGISFCYHFQ